MLCCKRSMWHYAVGRFDPSWRVASETSWGGSGLCEEKGKGSETPSPQPPSSFQLSGLSFKDRNVERAYALFYAQNLARVSSPHACVTPIVSLTLLSYVAGLHWDSSAITSVLYHATETSRGTLSNRWNA